MAVDVPKGETGPKRNRQQLKTRWSCLNIVVGVDSIRSTYGGSHVAAMPLGTCLPGDKPALGSPPAAARRNLAAPNMRRSKSVLYRWQVLLLGNSQASGVIIGLCLSWRQSWVSSIPISGSMVLSELLPLIFFSAVSPQKSVRFWFATGGAGFCISRKLASKMVPWAR